MSAQPPTDPVAGPAGWTGDVDRVGNLAAYFLDQSDRFTPEALRKAASDAGYTPEETEAAFRLAGERRAVQPVRARARRIVLAAYGLVYAILAVALLAAPNLDSYGAGEVSLIVLTIVLGIALVISVLWVKSRKRAPARLEGALMGFLALPLILLVGVAGLCVVTTRPFLVV